MLRATSSWRQHVPLSAYGFAAWQGTPCLSRAVVQGPFGQAPSLSEAEAGRAITSLAPSEKAAVAVEAYVAWSAERYGGRDGAGLRRVVSDLFRAKIDLEEAHAIALV